MPSLVEILGTQKSVSILQRHVKVKTTYRSLTTKQANHVLRLTSRIGSVMDSSSKYSWSNPVLCKPICIALCVAIAQSVHEGSSACEAYGRLQRHSNSSAWIKARFGNAQTALSTARRRINCAASIRTLWYATEERAAAFTTAQRRSGHSTALLRTAALLLKNGSCG